MKVHNTNTLNSLIRAFLLVVRFDENDQQMTDNPDEADVIMTDKSDELRKLYAKYGDTKFLVLFDTLRDRVETPEDNVFGAGKAQFEPSPLNLSIEVVKKYRAWASRDQKPKEKPVRHPLGDIVTFDKHYNVLVVDDSHEHLQTAAERLIGQGILPVDSPEMALNMLKLDDGREKPSIDAVLTDLNMRPDKMYPALNLDRYGLNEEVPAGISIMFEATRRGIPVAIVTDANHHQDWFSAMFSHIEEATVNGEKVIFCQEYGGKRWDFALKRLMEGGGS
jgi:CheY-like chemotaxis protein